MAKPLDIAKNTVFDAEITAITPEGNGVARHGDCVVFVPGTVTGDTVKIKIIKALSSYCIGRAEEILTPSPHRQKNADCAAFPSCGGCTLRHIEYEYELEAKKNQIEENFRRIGGIDMKCERILPSPKIDGYRNKAQYPAATGKDGGLRFGFYAAHSHRVTGIGLAEPVECKLQPPVFAQIVGAVEKFCAENRISAYSEETGRGVFRHLYIRMGEKSGEIMVCAVINAKKMPAESEFVRALTQFEGVKSIQYNINTAASNVILGEECRVLWGKPTISDTLCGLCFEISPLSFYQVNRSGAELLYSVVAEYASPSGGTLLDLYCGTGTIGLTMASRAEKLVGVEIIPDAIENARKNAAANSITNAEFLCADAGKAAEELLSRGIRPACVLLDPPRKGCDEATLFAVAQMAPEKIVMVSCSSDTAARDCARLREHGYEVKKITAVDMFPRTAHVECVILLTRKNS